MRRSDQLDATLAKQFAWCFVLPTAAVDSHDVERRCVLSIELGPASEAGDVSIEGIDEPEGRPLRDRARALCKSLAQATAEAWSEVDDEASARATKRLLARADRLGVELVGLDAHEVEAVRMLRLFVRHSSRMTKRQRERAAAVAALIPLEHPEAVDLLVEVARAGDRVLADALLADEEWALTADDCPGLAGRLSAIVEGGPTHACRAVAIDFLARAEAGRESVLALRRALRLPSFAVRARALHALAVAHPCEVLEEDVVVVLRDLVAHPPPDALRDSEREEEERMLADALIVSLAHVQPRDAEEALLDLIDADHQTVWLDEAWATEALAVAFPETAAVMVDHWLKCKHTHERVRAMGAIERLPTDLAEPRLRTAATDPAFSVRDRARRQWLERFGKVCPMRVEDLPGAGLLLGPPSDRFTSRLAVIHGRVREARRAMARALVSEPPSREGLVLLLQFVGDDADSGEPGFGARDEGWAGLLVQRFGALGVEGLCALAARFSEPESYGWMRRLGDLIERGVIAPEHLAPVRALAAAHVATDDVGRCDDALRILARVGASADLLDRVLAIALDDDYGSSEARALVSSWPDRAIDTRLSSEMALALAEGNWTRLRYAASIALDRGSPAAQVIAQRVLEVAERDVDAIDAAVECARRLRNLGGLDESWALRALGRPESPLFAVAARVWPGQGEIRAALDRALASTALGGASAVQAAVALLHAEPRLSPRDRRLPAILDMAAPSHRAELVHALCAKGAPMSLVAAHLEELLLSREPDVTAALVGVAAWLKSPKGRALLRAALPGVIDFELRADIEDALGTAPTPYWAEG